MRLAKALLQHFLQGADNCFLPEKRISNKFNYLRIKEKKSKCCRNVTFSENNFTTPRNNGSKCFKINVTWGRAKFSTKHNRVNGVQKNESWSFFLNSVVSQMCLNQSTYRRPPDMLSYVYPYFTEDRSNTAYLVEKHVYGGLCLLQPNVGNTAPMSRGR